MSYNILNKNVKFQGATQGTVEDLVDTHSTQSITGSKDFQTLTGSNLHVKNNLGIATTSPSEKLTVDTGNIQLTNGYQLQWGDSETAIFGNTASDYIRFKTAGLDRLTVDSAGKIGIGTINPNSKLQVAGNVSCTNITASGTITATGTISGSGAISGSAFYGDGSNLSGVGVSLASNGGLANSSGILVSPTTAVTKSTSMHSADVILIADSNNANVLRKVQAQQVADLFNAAVTTYGGDTANRVIVANGAGNIQGQTNLTFNGSVLTIAGDVSGSQVVSGNIGHFVTRVEAGAISLTTAAGLAGAGLVNNSGLLDVQVSGAVKIASDKIGISGSIAGNGLSFAGGADSLSSLAVNLDSNSGMAVGGSGLKTSFATLSSATPDVAADSIPFIDSAGDAKCHGN